MGCWGKGVVKDEAGGSGQGAKGFVRQVKEMGYRQQEAPENLSSEVRPDSGGRREEGFSVGTLVAGRWV